MHYRAIALLILLSISLFFFIRRVRNLYRYMMIGQKDERIKRGTFIERLKKVLVNALGQKKLFRDLNPGLGHALIFWGFLVVSVATVETLMSGFFRGFSLEILGPYIYPAYSFMKELFGLLVIVACLAALFRRYVTKPSRYEYTVDAQFDATFILLMILTLMATMFITDAVKLAMEMRGREAIVIQAFSKDYAAHPVSYLIANYGLLGKWSMSYIGLKWTWGGAWWIHLVVLLVFLNYIPYSKHLHLLSAIPNVYLGSLGAKGEVRKLDLEDENAESFGVSKINEFTWKQLLDLYACTECGRCSDKCPATNTQKDLSPRKIILDLKAHLMETAPGIISKKDSTAGEEKQMIGGAVKENELWACTTCRACQQECPVFIEHVDKILDMRRNLVLMESRFPEEVQNTFKNMETNYNPWSFGYSTRADWAEGLDVPLASEKKDFEYLFWVGCAGSFDERGKKISRAFVKILKKANVNFAILGVEEKCTGDSARRIGNEYLAQMMIQENVQTLNNYNVKKIITFCPHCFNSIKNDFSQFGGKYEVVHHSVFIRQLINDGKLKLLENEKMKLTYHDSCYLGRYNDIYDAPREVLKAGKGIELKEMKRNHDKAFCCGAGGGRMWMEETEGTRISENRVKEACDLSCDAIATACPFCLTMMEDGLKEVDKTEKIKAYDIAEIVEKMI